MNPTDKSVVDQIIKLESTIKEQNKASEANLKALANAKAQRASQPKLSWLGRLVNFLRHSPKLHKLHEKLFSVFSDYRAETIAQQDLDGKVEKILNKQSSINAKIKTNRAAIETLLKQSSPVDFIAPLFGGKDQFDALPVLKLEPKNSVGSYVEDITSNQMRSNSVMRFTDKFGCIGFAVRSAAVSKKGKLGAAKIQIFQQVQPGDNGTWTTQGTQAIMLTRGNHFLINGRMSKEDEVNYDKLCELITTGKATVKNSFNRDVTLTLDSRDPGPPKEPEPIDEFSDI